MNLFSNASRGPAVAAGFLVAAAVLLSACGNDQPAAAAPAPMPVSTLRVAAEKLPITLDAVGQAEGSREVEIRARVAGVLEKRLYQEGAAVSAGKTLFVIDPAPYELAVQQAKAALLEQQVRSELAEADVKRLEPLAAEKAISQRELDEAHAAQRQAIAAIAGAQAKLKEAQLNLSYTQVSAPIAGLSGRALRSEGSLVTPETESGRLTTLVQVNPIWVRFSLADRDFQRIRRDSGAARVQMVAEDGAVLADGGTLNFTGNAVDARLGTVELRAEFSNPQALWLPGQFVKVRVLAGEQTAVRVPQTALLQMDNARSIMTIDAEGKAAARPVHASSWIGNDAVITEGLKDGDLVITDNLIKLKPGTPVQAKSASLATVGGNPAATVTAPGG